MKFVRDPSLGADWARSICGRYRIARIRLHLGTRYAAYLWWPGLEGLPELIDTYNDDRVAARACELNARYGGAP